MIIEYISARRVAQAVGVKDGTVRKWFRDGKIAGCQNKHGSVWIDIREVQRILADDGHDLNRQADLGRIEA